MEGVKTKTMLLYMMILINVATSLDQTGKQTQDDHEGLNLERTLTSPVSNESSKDSDSDERKQINIIDDLNNQIIEAILNNDIANITKLLEVSTIDNFTYIIDNELCKTDDTIIFDSLIQAADALANRNRASIIYLSLAERLDKTNDKDEYILKLIDSINNRVINDSNVEITIRNKAVKIAGSLSTEMKSFCLDMLKTLLIDKQIIDIKSTYNIINSINQLGDKEIEDIYKDFLMSVSMSGEKIYKEIFNNLNKVVINYGQAYVHELQLHLINVLVIEKFDNSFISVILERCNEYALLEQKYENRVAAETLIRFRSQLKRVLPLSIYNVFFAKVPCIRNVGEDKYLITKDERGETYNPPFRNVFTRARNSTDGYIEWKFEYHRDGDRFVIIHAKFNGYLYASDSKVHRERRSIGMVETRPRPNIDHLWNLEIIGDYIYLKDVRHNEYLSISFEDELKDDWKEVYAYTYNWTHKYGCSVYKQCMWAIEDCEYLME